MARIALPVVGAVITTYMGIGPAAGWALGSAAAAIFFPPEGPNTTSTGPRLDDLKVTNADYGGAIPIARGTVGGIAGTIIWATDLEEVRTENKQEVGGKGGGGATATTVTYSYFASFAVLFGEGPAKEVLRLWADNKLIFDARAPTAEQIDDIKAESDGSVREQLIKAIMGSEETFNTSIDNLEFRFYNGSEDQEIDPLIAADRGDLANANNGMVYIVFERLPLENFGNRIPNITAEIVFTDGEESIVQGYELDDTGVNWSAFRGKIATDFETGVVYRVASDEHNSRWDSFVSLPYNSTVDGDVDVCTLSKRTGFLYAYRDGGISIIDPNTMEERVFQNLEIPNSREMSIQIMEVPGLVPGLTIECLVIAQTSTTLPGNYHGLFVYVLSSDGLRIDPGKAYFSGGYETLLHGPATQPEGGLSGGGYLMTVCQPRNDDLQSFNIFEFSGWEGTGLIDQGGDQNTYWVNTKTQVQLTGLSDTPLVTLIPEGTNGFTPAELQAQFPFLDWPADDFGIRLMRNAAIDKSDYNTVVLYIRFEKVGDSSDYLDAWFGWDTRTREFIWGTDDFQLGIELDRGVLLSDKNQHLLVNSNTYGSTYGLTSTGLGAMLVTEYDMATGEIIKTRDVEVPGFLTVGEPLPEFLMYDTLAEGIVMETNTGSKPTPVVVNFKAGAAESVTVQSIIDELSVRSGLPEDIYLETTAKTCRGFYMTGQETAKSALSRLGSTYNFNIIESDFGLKVKELDVTPTVVSVDEGDLTENSDGILIEESRVPESVLPSLLSLTYLDFEFEYQPNTINAKIYNTGEAVTSSIQSASTTIPIVMSNSEAKQLSETMLESAWEERWGAQYGLTQKYIATEPTDVLSIDRADISLINRVSTSDLGVNLRLDISGVNTDSSTYVSNSTADGVLGYTPIGFERLSATKHFIMQLPYLRDSDYAQLDNQDAIYHAGSTYGIGNFGTTLLEYSETGEAWANKEVFSTEATWGFIESVLPDADTPFTPDLVTTVTVRVIAGAGLESITDDGLLTDFGNTMAIYVYKYVDTESDDLFSRDPYMEIMQFRDVTPLGNNRYEISYLLRGRRGTEVHAYGYRGGETFVMLSEAQTRKTVQSGDKVGVEVYYRAPVIGSNLADAVVRPLKSRGTSLIPYAPVNPSATTDGTDITISWHRRSRYGGYLRDLGEEVPFSEIRKEMVIEIWNASETTLIRTLEAGVSNGYLLDQVEYSNADIITDFGTIPSELYLHIYELTNTVVERGYQSRIIHTVEVENV